MFDRSVYAPSFHSHHTTERVIEKRAPTDESVRLLKEMEKAAEAKIDSSRRLFDNRFDCLVQTLRFPHDDTLVARAVFTLNGKVMKAEAELPMWSKPEPADILGLLRDDMAKQIANEVINSAIERIRF
jgi:hypothetical protein